MPSDRPTRTDWKAVQALGEAASEPTEENPEFDPADGEDVFTSRNAVELEMELRKRQAAGGGKAQ